MLADAHAYLDEFTPALQGVAHRALIRLGDPAEEILAVATAETADLVVLATHGRRGLNRLIMGSTTETVLRKSAVPVLTLRTANLVPDKVATTRGQATL
jgi:nucleotide-binding universal stress UspA family protein